jgi:hypothetical protein
MMLVFAMGLSARAAESSAPTVCKDGTTSTATGRGACSGHGGVQKTAAAQPAAPAAPAPAAASRAAPAAPPASGTPTTCKDGTTSTATGRGACSGHGGVQKASKSKPASDASASSAAPATGAPAASKSSASKSAPTATPTNNDPTGATAKCKDGTYSKSQHHSGTCSSHGGVAEWLTPQ